MLPILLAAVAGGVLAKNMMDYPAGIKNLRRQIPKDERDDFMREYKGLSKESKTQFKKFLSEANLAEAGKLISRDLSGYNVKGKAKGTKTAVTSAQTATLVADTAANNGINERVKNLLNSHQLDSDPQLVAEAAKRYEKISGYNQMNIVDKTRKLLDVSQ